MSTLDARDDIEERFVQYSYTLEILNNVLNQP